MPGWTELLIVLALVLLIFGAGKLPSVMGDVAKGVKSFKKGMRDEEEHNSESKDKKPETTDTSSDSGKNQD